MTREAEIEKRLKDIQIEMDIAKKLKDKAKVIELDKELLTLFKEVLEHKEWNVNKRQRMAIQGFIALHEAKGKFKRLIRSKR